SSARQKARTIGYSSQPPFRHDQQLLACRNGIDAPAVHRLVFATGPHVPLSPQAVFVVISSHWIDISCAWFVWARSIFELDIKGDIPMNVTVHRMGALAACFIAGIISVCWHLETRASISRDPKTMSNRLDRPE